MGLLARLLGSSDQGRWTAKDWDAYRRANYSEEDWARYRARVATVRRTDRANRDALDAIAAHEARWK